MNFSEALKKLTQDRNVGRSGWFKNTALGLKEDRFGRRYFVAGTIDPRDNGIFFDSEWSPTIDDMFAEDWEVRL